MLEDRLGHNGIDSSIVLQALQLGPAEKGLGDLEGSIITRMAVRDC